ncbi:MAG: KOW domain-containing RNA-binding protein [Oscillospiraceae bacterium]|jgi:ribosomal protein L14E/L6E/L27E|nr:KOW domain-containing RNA-binding protein [Oscillospiraceae bacterium]
MVEQKFEMYRVVESKAGRDKRRLFVVVGIRDDGLVLVADGDLRKLAKPKPKKRMHLKPRHWILRELAELVEKGILKDSDIRRGLTDIKNRMTENMEENTFGEE